jgi:hypothetical protein
MKNTMRVSRMVQLCCLAAAFLAPVISGCDIYNGPPADTDADYSADDEEYTADYDPNPGVLTGLAGTTWRWGASVLEFEDDDTVKFRQTGAYPYTYTAGNRTGGISGIGSVDQSAFTISADYATLEIINYRGNSQGYNALFRRRKPGAEMVIPDTVVGTEWNRGSDTFSEGAQWEIFFTGDIAINRSSSTWFVNPYTYNRTKKRGKIEFINEFEILQDGGELSFVRFKNYGHQVSFFRVRY